MSCLEPVRQLPVDLQTDMARGEQIGNGKDLSGIDYFINMLIHRFRKR